MIITTLDNYISYLNTLYNSSSTPPTSGEEDYIVWTSLANIAISVWENEEGMLWNELFVKLQSAATGDKTTTADDYSYAVPTDFRFPASGTVWVGSGTSKTPFRVIKQVEVQLVENDSSNWCYFMMDGSPTLEFNPNCTLSTGDDINYNYYKSATTMTTGSSAFDMSDPMFCVYFALAELKKEEGNSGELNIASQKLMAMKSKNEMPSYFQADQLTNNSDDGFGI